MSTQIIYQQTGIIYRFMQYNRLENVEIIGIPENIPDEEIEETIIDILRRLGLIITHYDIAGCQG